MAHSVASRKVQFVVAAGVLAVAGLVGSRALNLGRAVAVGNLISVSGADSLGQGLQDVYRLQLSDPAPAGGLQVTLSSTTATCKLARTEYERGDGTPLTIVIPSGQRSATFVAQTVENATGSCGITVDGATPSGWTWTTPALTVPLAQGKLRIQALAHHIALNADNDPFFVEVGVPAADSVHLRLVQDLSMQLASPLAVTVCSDNTSIGQIANVWGDETPSGCQQNPIVAPYSLTVPGDFQFDPINGNDSTDVHVTATAPGFLPDTQTVRVPSHAVTLHGPEKLGAGLQDNYSVRLSSAPLNDQPVTLTVSNPALCAVAASEQELADSTISVTVPAGNYRADFVVQGVTQATPASCTVTATVVGTSPPVTDYLDIWVQQPALRIRALSSTEGQFSPDDPSYVELGVPAGVHRLRYVQDLARGLQPSICSGVGCGGQQVAVTATSNHPETGCIVGPNGQCGAQAIAYVPLTYSLTVPGDLSFRPVAGSTDPVRVTVSAPGFIDDYKDVKVLSATLQLKPVRQPGDIGSSLQDDYKVKLLDATGHPDTDVTLTANANCLVARDPYSVGANQLVIRVDASHTFARFTVQATGNPGSPCHIDATATNYTAADIDIDIVEPGIQIRQLARSMPVNGDDDAFVVQIGLPNRNNTQLRYTQTLSPKAAPGAQLPIDVCSDDPTVGKIVKLINASACQSDAIFQSSATNVPGDLKFRPLLTGITTATVTAPGFLTMDPEGKVPVRVGRDSITLNTPSTLGSNLQDRASVRLSKPADSSGVIVTITTDPATKCVVASDDHTPGTASLFLSIAAGDNSATFYVSALNLLGNDSCTVRARASSYIGDDSAIDIQERAFQIDELDSTLGTGSVREDFVVLLGVQSDGGFAEQAVRSGGDPVPVTVCSSNPTIGRMDPATNACQSGTFQSGQSRLTFTFYVNAANTSRGCTTVSAVGGADEDDQRLCVSPTSVRLSRRPTAIAKYLQGTYTVYVNNRAGASVMVHAEPASVCVASLDPTRFEDGTDKTVVIPNGSSRGSFVLQGVEVGTCTVTLSGPGFDSVSRAIPVYQAALRIAQLASTMSSLAKSDPFFVEIGPANPAVSGDVETNGDNQRAITQPLPLRAGVSQVDVRVCSLNLNAGIIHDPLGSPGVPCVTVPITNNDSQTANLTYDPVAALPNDVTAEAVNYQDIKPTREHINTRPAALNLIGPTAIGLNLQDDYTAHFNPAPPDGTTVTMNVTSGCGVWSTNSPPFDQAPASTLTLPVPPGQADVSFWVSALAKPGCTVSIASSNPGYSTDSTDVTIDNPSARLSNLDTTRSTGADDAPFNVDIGYPNGAFSQLRTVQQVRSDNTNYRLPVHDSVQGGFGIPLVVCSDNNLVGTIIGGTPAISIPEVSCVHVVMQQRSSTLGLAFHSAGQGCANVSVSEDGTPLQPIGADHRRVCVVQDNIWTTHPPVGASLQNDYEVVLSKVASQLATVTLTTSTPTICALGPIKSGPFGATASVTMPPGHTRAPFVVQGLALGTCTITPSISLSGYVPTDTSIEVVQPAFRIINLLASLSSFAKNEPFNVEVGIPLQGRTVGVNSLLQDVQPARFGGPGVPVVVCSSRPLVAEIVGANLTTGCKQVTIAPLATKTSDTDTQNNLLLDPKGSDPASSTTAVTATSPPDAVPQFYPAVQNVRVKAVVPNVAEHPLGSGMQDVYVLSLSRTVSAPTTFTITSLNTNVCTLALKETDPGQPVIHPIIPANSSRVNFFIHAIENVLDTCELTITTDADGIDSGYAEIPIVSPAAQIIGIDPTVSTQSPPDSFAVEVGVPGSGRVSLTDVQTTRVDGPANMLTVCHSGVGSVNGVSNGCFPIIVPVDESQTAYGALTFDPGDVPGPARVCATGWPYYVHIQKDCIQITVAAVTLTVSPHKVGAGLQDAFQLVLSRTLAQAYTFTVSTDTPDMCKVALNPADCGVPLPNVPSLGVPMPAGHSRATFYVQAMESVSGDCHLLLTAPGPSGVSSGEAFIPIVQPGLRIVNLDTSLSTQSNPGPFNIEVGVPNKGEGTLADVQAVRACGPGVSVNVCNAIPPPPASEIGTIGGEVNGCVPIVIIQQSTPTPLPPPSQSPAVYFDPGHVPGSTVITADALGFIRTDAGSKDVTVAARTLKVAAHNLGASLQDQFSLTLSATLSQDVTFRVKSADTTICTVALSASVAGGEWIDLPILKGRTRAYFYVQAMDAVIDTCHLSLIAPADSGVTSGTADIPVVESGLQIINLSGTIKTASDDDKFNVVIGVPRTIPTGLADTTQSVRHGGLVHLKVCNTIPPPPDSEIGSIVGEGSDGCVSATIGSEANTTADVAFHAGTIPGHTTVLASGDNLISTDAASKDVTVSTATISLSGPDAIGSGLEDTYTVAIDPKAPSGGLPITLKSCTPALCLVAQDENTAAPLTYQDGCQVYSTSIAYGHTYIHFAIQALEGVSGDCIVTAASSDPRYAPDQLTVPIVQPGLRIRGLDPTTTVVAKNDPFNVDTGVSRVNLATLRLVQAVRPGGPGLTVQVCSTDATVALVKSGTTEAACVTTPVPMGASGTDDGVLAFDAQKQGNTRIIATAPSAAPPGFITTDAGSVDVIVAAAALSFAKRDTPLIGAGLMHDFYLKSSSAVGATTPITVTSLTPTICLVSPDANTAGTSPTTVTIASGYASKTFFIHGIEQATGQCALLAHDPAGQLSDGYGYFDVVVPAVSITYLATSKTAPVPDDAFNVNVGVANSGLTTLAPKQDVRAGSTGFPVTVCSGDPLVGLIVSASGADTCGSGNIPAGAQTINTLKFRVAGNGLTVIAPPVDPHLIVTDAGSVEVTVSGFSASVLNNSTVTSIGAGLQQNSFYVQRTGSTVSAASITVTSLTPTICQVSTDGTVAGGSAATVTIPAGAANSGTFWIQALETVGAACQVQTVGPYYTPGVVLSLPIVQPAIQLIGVLTPNAYNAPPDDFNVQIGVASGTTFVAPQPVRGGRAPFVITLRLTDDPADTQHPGQLISAFSATGQLVTTQIPAASAANTATLQFQPLATGVTTVSAQGTGLVSCTSASVLIQVSNGGC